MVTPGMFFTAENVRMCIFYEYIRKSTPKQTRIEFKKANQDVKLKTIMGWYTRFKMGHFGMDVLGAHEDDVNKDDPSIGMNKEDAQKFNEIYAALEEESQGVPKFDFQFFETNSLGFVDIIKKIIPDSVKEGDTTIEYVLKEMEIFVKNDAQPKHVLIGIEYFEKRNNVPQRSETDMLEVYHCDNGVVMRRGKLTQFLEGDDYEYIRVAGAACSEILYRICHKRFGFLKIGADSPDENTAERFFKSIAYSLNSLSKNSIKFPSAGISTRLIHFGYIFNLGRLTIHYDDKKFKREDAQKMKEMFCESGEMASCYFQNETFDEAAIKSALNIKSDSQETKIGKTIAISVAPQRIFMQRRSDK